MPGRGNPGCSGAVVRSFLGEVEPDPGRRARRFIAVANQRRWAVQLVDPPEDA